MVSRCLAPLIIRIYTDEKYKLPVQSTFFWDLNDKTYWFFYLYETVVLFINIAWIIAYDNINTSIIIRVH